MKEYNAKSDGIEGWKKSVQHERTVLYKTLEVVIFLGKRNRLGLFQLLVVLLHKSSVDSNFSGSQSRSGDEFEAGVTNQLPR